MVKFRLSYDIEPGDQVVKRGNGKIIGTVVHTTLKTATVEFQGGYPVIIPKSRLRKVPWNFVLRVVKSIKEKIKIVEKGR